MKTQLLFLFMIIFSVHSLFAQEVIDTTLTATKSANQWKIVDIRLNALRNWDVFTSDQFKNVGQKVANGNRTEYKCLISFGELLIHKSIIKSAKLVLSGQGYTNVGNNMMKVFSCSDSWTESTITYRNWPSNIGGSVSVDKSIGSNVNYEIDVTRLVTDESPGRNICFNLQLAFNAASGEHMAIFHGTRSSNPELRPKLVIEYEKQPDLLVNFVSQNPAEGTIQGELSQTVKYLFSNTAVEAIPKDGYRFLKWSDEESRFYYNNPIVIADITKNMNLTAVFVSTNISAEERVPQKDAYVHIKEIEPGKANTNYGDAIIFHVYDSKWGSVHRDSVRTFIDFGDVTNSNELIDAKLFLYHYKAADGTVPSNEGSNAFNIYNVKEDWSENTITWTNQPPYDTAISPVEVDPSTGIKDFEIDVTSLIKASGKANFMMRLSNGIYQSIDIARFSSKENADGSLRPRLELTYKDNATNIDTNHKQSEFKLYPNPASSSVTLEFTEANKALVTVVNMLGKTVYQKQFIGSKLTIPTAEFTKGLYMVQVRKNSQTTVEKLMIK